MNQKILVSLMVAVIVLVSIHLVIIISEKIEELVIDSDIDDVDEYLTLKEIFNLVASNPEFTLIGISPNDMNGVSKGKGTLPGGDYRLFNSWPNGTRTYDEFSNNDTLLKSIKIYDDPERDILIILK